MSTSRFGFFIHAFGLALFLESWDFAPWLVEVKYTLPLLALLAQVFVVKEADGGHESQRAYFRRYLWLYAGILAWSFIVHLARGTLRPRFFEELYFILGPVIFAFGAFEYFRSTDVRVASRTLFSWVAISYCVQAGSNIVDIAAHPGTLLAALVSSDIPTETGNISFVLGLFVAYFALTGEKVRGVVALLLTVLSFKRIVLAGLLVVVGLILARRWFRGKALPRPYLIPLLGMVSNLGVVILLLQILNGAFDDLISEVLSISVDELTTGRVSIVYNVVYESFGSLVSWSGRGVGSVTPVLEAHGSLLVNMHSDVLKNFVEFGWVLFCAWLIVHYHLHTRPAGLLIMAVLLNVYFLTDNVFIYFNVMTSFYLLVGLLMRSSGPLEPTGQVSHGSEGPREALR